MGRTNRGVASAWPKKGGNKGGKRKYQQGGDYQYNPKYPKRFE